MRAIIILSTTTLLSGCIGYMPGERSEAECQQASHALQVHDSRIEAARMPKSYGFSARLPSRGYKTYHCSTISGDHIACSTVMPSVRATESAQLNRLMRERATIEARAARACQI